MSAQVDYFFDYVSPFSYLANTQLPGLIERTGAVVNPRPILLGGLNQLTGNSPPIAVPNKGRYLANDIERWVRRYNLAFRQNPHFPPKTVTALRGAIVALEEGLFDTYHEAVFRGIWVEQLEPDDRDALRALIDKGGLDGAHILERCGEQAVKDQLRANTAEANERGAFGVPTFFFEDQMFWGNDRLDFLEEALH